MRLIHSDSSYETHPLIPHRTVIRQSGGHHQSASQSVSQSASQSVSQPVKLAVAIFQRYEQVTLCKEAVEVLDVDVVASDEVIR